MRGSVTSLLLAAALLPPWSHAQTVNICDRTPQVRDAIIQRLAASDCTAVTAEGLTQIGYMDLSRKGIASLKPDDFAGLTRLEALYLYNNHLVELSQVDPLFAGLPSLRELDLFGQTETSELPATRLPAAVPLLVSASDSMRQGFVRIINESNESGSVRILAFDDAGSTADPIEVPLAANEAVHFNADDLENGNAAKGIETGFGLPVQGDWRLDVETALDVRVLSYVRTGDGFLTAMHDVLQRSTSMLVSRPEVQGRLAAWTFNPASNTSRVSKLRLINTGANAASVNIEGVDDQGDGAGPVTLTLAGGESRTLSALDLEEGAPGLTGMLGDGAGKWRLFISAGEDNDESVVGMSLLDSASGHLSNLSNWGVGRLDWSLRGYESISLPLLVSASDSMRQGFVRIINEYNSGWVRIRAFDDGGMAVNPVSIPLGAYYQAVHFNAGDLENGNPAKGIETGFGLPVQGDWRLDVETALDVRVLAYVRTGDGFLTAMHDMLQRDARGRLAAWTFNPASNTSRVSKLRLANTGANAANVSIQGVDDQGDGAGPVTLTLAAGESRTLSALDLEEGAQGLTGMLGDGAGKWRLFISTDESVVGMSLLESVSGHLSNLSTMGVAIESQ